MPMASTIRPGQAVLLSVASHGPGNAKSLAENPNDLTHVPGTAVGWQQSVDVELRASANPVEVPQNLL